MDWRVTVEHVVTADSHAEAVYDFWCWLNSVPDIDAYTDAVPIIDPDEEWPPPRAEDCVIRDLSRIDDDGEDQPLWRITAGGTWRYFTVEADALRYVGAF